MCRRHASPIKWPFMQLAATALHAEDQTQPECWNMPVYSTRLDEVNVNRGWSCSLAHLRLGDQQGYASMGPSGDGTPGKCLPGVGMSAEALPWDPAHQNGTLLLWKFNAGDMHTRLEA